ncbi:MAG: DUF6065 family protein [Myxococcota bacterium]
MSTTKQDELIRFFTLVPDAPAPRRADPSLFGSVPLRAYQHCEPFTVASGFGWHVFPPVDFALAWDGTSIVWMPPGAREWRVMEQVPFPGPPLEVPEKFRDLIGDRPAFPDFMTALREPGLIQVWSGALARTRPDWSILVRPPANLPRNRGYEVLEGIIESDWWFGPLISNIRLCRTGRPILFRKRWPLYQIHPVPRVAYAKETLDSMSVHAGIESLAESDWRAYAKARNLRAQGPPGSYKAEARRRRRGSE